MFLFASVAYRKCYSSLLYAESIEPLIQSGFSHVFGVYSEPIETVWRLHLSFYLSHYPIRVMNPLIGAISKWKYLLLLKLCTWCPQPPVKFGVKTADFPSFRELPWDSNKLSYSCSRNWYTNIFDILFALLLEILTIRSACLMYRRQFGLLNTLLRIYKVRIILLFPSLISP